MNLENGAIINQYKILSALGKGGMGEVFLAQDAKLDRKVALKILPPEFAEDADRMSRFVREAKSVSALNHPNIITIYEIGECGGTHFIATEFIDGKTLKDYVKSNPLNYKLALEIAIQIASALDEAHSAGIVHRDIKPDNVMIRANGSAKILDFGIAKLSTSPRSGEEDATALQSPTQAGMIIGTPQFMSPEQARGRDVDHQSDIFSFGVVFYEMLSGYSPFDGETVSDVIAAVLTKDPPALSEIPTELGEIVNKTLQKEKRNRYQTAIELLQDLIRVNQELEMQSRLEGASFLNLREPKTQILRAAIGAEENPKSIIKNLKSVAVLPFTNMSADEDNEYFCDGLAEELLNALSKINDLKVAARTSAFSFKGKNTNVSEIGEKLSVKTVLEGSVRRSGNRLRISVQLINASDGFQLWSERYDREMQDIFEMQDEIALAVAEALKLELFGVEKAAVLKKGTENKEAYELYLKGRYYWNKRTAENIKKAIEQFKAATDRDPNYAHAYVGLADCYVVLNEYAGTPMSETLPQAKKYAGRAIALDNQLAEPHSALGSVNDKSWQWMEAEREFKRAIELNPNYATAYHWYSLFLRGQNRFAEAALMINRAHELDPLSSVIGINLSEIYQIQNDYQASIENSLKIIELDPNFSLAYNYLGRSYLKQGRYFEALEKLEKAVELRNRDSYTLKDLGYGYAVTGKHTEAINIAKELEEMHARKEASGRSVAAVYAGLGDKDKAFEWLEKDFQTRNGDLGYIRWKIPYESLRDDPRFKDLLKRMSLPE